MTDSLSAEAIKKTQDSLGKFVKKPPLTEKLLRKPPFKFLHDIINVVSIFPCQNCLIDHNIIKITNKIAQKYGI